MLQVVHRGHKACPLIAVGKRVPLRDATHEHRCFIKRLWMWIISLEGLEGRPNHLFNQPMLPNRASFPTILYDRQGIDVHNTYVEIAHSSKSAFSTGVRKSIASAWSKERI